MGRVKLFEIDWAALEVINFCFSSFNKGWSSFPRYDSGMDSTAPSLNNYWKGS